MDKIRQAPLMVCFIADTISVRRITDIARRLNFRTVWMSTIDQLISPAEEQIGLPDATNLQDAGAILLDRLTIWHPALICFDVGDEHIPWRRWLALIKSEPATQRLIVICFGARKAQDMLEAAQRMGADAVFPSDRFFLELEDILQRYAHIQDAGSILKACQEPLSEQAVIGLEFFNQGRYFEAHEFLEKAWNQDQPPGRELYRAILQVAVAYLQITRGNYSGAIKMFLRLRQWIDPLPDRCRGVDIKQLRADARLVYNHLVSLGRERMGEIEPGLLRPVNYQA
jgi:tetratricopeptide (TPR) repeat protein